jgi:hypothetical protein
MGDVAGYNWLQMNPDMIEGSKNDRVTVHTYSSLAHLRHGVPHYSLRCSLTTAGVCIRTIPQKTRQLCHL